MRARRTMTGLALTAGLAVSMATTAGVATASAPSGDRAATTSVVSHRMATTKAEQRRVEDYWTPARMKSATPVGIKIKPEKGKPGGGTSGGTAVQQQPQARFGKVFFTEGRTNYVCSGTATNSGNGDVVTTAGHCVNEGPGAFVTNFVFVPAYNNGAAPYGTWTAETLITTPQWAGSGDFNYDVGFAVMLENGTQSLTDAVGGYDIAFDQPRGLTYQAFGYPAARPFDGKTLWACSGAVVQDTFGGSQDQGLACNMTGGSSGGGWITGSKLNSVTSFGYTGVKNVLYGPFFGSVIQTAYTSASNAL